MTTDATEGTPVQKPEWLQSNITLGNLINLFPLVVGLITGAMAYGQLTLRMDNMEQYRVERSRSTDGKFADLNKALEKVPTLEYKVTVLEEAVKSTNLRMEASVGNISARLAEMNQLLGALDTKFAVLTQRFESESNKRAELELFNRSPSFNNVNPTRARPN